MKVDNMIRQIKDIEATFLKYGFIYPPLEPKRIASLLIRGFDAEQIYNFGCDTYCGA